MEDDDEDEEEDDEDDEDEDDDVGDDDDERFCIENRILLLVFDCGGCDIGASHIGLNPTSPVVVLLLFLTRAPLFGE